MFIKCWGSRGSIPVSGSEYIRYGGDTTCIEVRTKKDDIIIIDGGTGIRRLGIQLIKEGRYDYHMLFTHAHWDHLMGFPFFKPLYLKHTEVTVYRCPFPGRYVDNMISKVLSPPNFPVRYADLNARITYATGCPDSFEIGPVTVFPIRLSHPNGGGGYKFVEDGKTFVFLTDNELGYVHPGGLEASEYLKFSEGADLLIHDGEYTPREYEYQIEWGHSTYSDAVDLAIQAGASRLGLFHINQERTDDQVDEIVGICRKMIQEKKKRLDCFAVSSDMTFEL
jgi:phosphoribosyl 1,2-cyclic phosphodiesterase